MASTKIRNILNAWKYTENGSKMNAAIGAVLAVAFLKAIQESKLNRNVRYPDETVKRPRIFSEYPLRYLVINDAIGGVSHGIKKVFPNAKFLGFQKH